MERITLKIDGMTCGHCVSQVTRALTSVPGVKIEQLRVGQATVSFDPAATSEEQITRSIEDAGYSVAAATH